MASLLSHIGAALGDGRSCPISQGMSCRSVGTPNAAVTDTENDLRHRRQ